MSKTVQEIQAWLISPDALKVILVEVSGVNKTTNLNNTDTIYLSSRPYVTNTINYDPCIIGGISYSENLSLEGSNSINYGDIELDNTDGSNDIYLTYYWTNRPVNIYIGDARWDRSDFSLIFTGIVAELISKDRNTLNIVLLDTMARLNVAISENTYAYSGSVGNIISSYNGSNARVSGIEDTLRPLTFGECFNVNPVQVAAGYWYNGSMHGALYQFHDGLAEDVIEVRDNGAPVDFTKVLSDGCFYLANSSYGTISASVQGNATGSYSSQLHSVISKILTTYGGENKLSATDLDFTMGSTPYVGYYCTSRENVLDVCNKLASSAGYQLVNDTVTAYVGSTTNVATAGKVRLVQLDLSAPTVVYTITDDDMLLNTFRITEVIPAKSSLKLNYCKNWNAMDSGLAESINPLSVMYFKEEWLDNRYISSNNRALFKDSREPVAEETYLINKTETTTELNRRKTLREIQRYVVTATYLPHMFFAHLGEGVQFSLSENKLSSIIAGKTGIIYSINRNWLKNTIEIGVLI